MIIPQSNCGGVSTPEFEAEYGSLHRLVWPTPFGSRSDALFRHNLTRSSTIRALDLVEFHRCHDCEVGSLKFNGDTWWAELQPQFHGAVKLSQLDAGTRTAIRLLANRNSGALLVASFLAVGAKSEPVLVTALKVLRQSHCVTLIIDYGGPHVNLSNYGISENVLHAEVG